MGCCGSKQGKLELEDGDVIVVQYDFGSIPEVYVKRASKILYAIAERKGISIDVIPVPAGVSIGLVKAWELEEGSDKLTMLEAQYAELGDKLDDAIADIIKLNESTCESVDIAKPQEIRDALREAWSPRK